MTARETVSSYFAAGYRLVFWPADGDAKGPHESSWPDKLYTVTDYQDGYRVGFLTGVEVAPGRFLHDVDVDWAPGSVVAQRLLPDTHFVFGRASKPMSHCFYTLPEALATTRYEDIDGSSLIELRGTKTDGTVGLQTMVPPSTWSKNGQREPLTFVRNGQPAYLDNPSHFTDLVCLVAIGMLLAKHLGVNGFGHPVRLAWAGFLLRAGVSPADLIVLGEAISTYTNNREVGDVRTVVESTEVKLRLGRTSVSGSKALAEAIGENGQKVIRRISEWLGTAELILDPNDPLPSAKAFVLANYSLDDTLTLRRQVGVFYSYQPTLAAYHERDDASVRADLYSFLEVAKTRAEDGQLRPFRPTKAKVSNVLDALYAVTNLDASMQAPCWLANDPGLNPLDILACPNGLLHILTRALVPATPDFFTLNGLDFAFDPDARQAPQWLKFLGQLWPNDPESVAALQEFCGYVLTPDTRLQKLLLLVGPKRSGKGVTGRVLRRLVGERNTCSPTLASFGDQFGKQVLISKTLAIISDARIGGRIDTASVAEALLSITGEDTQTVQRKFLPDWNGKLSARFVLLANELPRIGDVSGALASRFIILVLKESFYGKEDLGLYDRLVTELPSILNWALEGRDRLYARGWFVQPKSATELIEELVDLSSPEAAMLRECTERKVGAWVEQPELFQTWQAWCRVNGHEQPGTTQTFAKSVRTALPWISVKQRGSKGEQVRCWEGLALLRPQTPMQPKLPDAGDPSGR